MKSLRSCHAPAPRVALVVGTFIVLSQSWAQPTPDPPASPRVLDPLVAGAAALFGTGTDDFERMFRPLRFQWTSARKTQARIAESAAAGGPMTLFEGKLDPVEALVDFTDGRLSQITIHVFTRGDARRDVGREAFARMVADCRDGVARMLGDPGKARGPGSTGAIRGTDGWVWARPGVAALLEWSSQRVQGGSTGATRRSFQAEFLRLRLAPPAKPALGAGAAPGATVRRADLAAHVRRDPASGDVWVADVPMVDQGRKGYCVVASCERLFRFYGMQVDQHELAQMAESSAKDGTKYEKMIDALRKLQMRLKLRMRELIGTDYHAFVRDVETYNRAARRRGLATFDTKNSLLTPDLYARMDKDVLRAAKCQGAGFRKYQARIKEHANAGVPLLWALELGVYPEEGRGNRQTGGGHMRLIIGYNEKQGQVIFSDSWGAGHELKRMRMDDAFAVTTGLFMVEPNVD